ncbi:MAG: 16S rRNA (guanine(527)-N(7))-methyltransferase RsmG [Holosporales bacterium]|jgi:16S rRNA (guanine527-N7)-methyltransferase|nr:16S rRNA (guanine(527)-N(7))-methyltransferase RsmG [Holosporales bacterium]
MLCELPIQENVPRETFLKLKQYQAILLKWQKAVNLISHKDIDQVWHRHVLDSLQLIDYLQPGSILDIGSGGGFPGMVLAIATKHTVSLVDSDQKKCIFLEEVKSELKLANLKICNTRIENLNIAEKFQNITARAFSSLQKTLQLSTPLLNPLGQYLFFKGSSYKQELEEALSIYKFGYEVIESRTDKSGVILRMKYKADGQAN